MRGDAEHRRDLALLELPRLQELGIVRGDRDRRVLRATTEDDREMRASGAAVVLLELLRRLPRLIRPHRRIDGDDARGHDPVREQGPRRLGERHRQAEAVAAVLEDTDTRRSPGSMNPVRCVTGPL
jgi:hypothetical protein